MKGNIYDSYLTHKNVDFGDRLSKDTKTKERSRMKFLHEEKYDESTGQPLFHPKVGRPPLARKDYDNIPVTEKLYRDGQHKKQIKEEKIIRERESRQHSANKTKVQEKSEELLEQKKARKFLQIFQILDSDGDGIISADKIDISNLAPDILEIFTPLL